MMALSVVGIHPVITSTALLATFSAGGTDVHPALLVQAHLIGWGAGTMSSSPRCRSVFIAGLYQVYRGLFSTHNMAGGFAYAAGCGGFLWPISRWAMSDRHRLTGQGFADFE